MRNRSVIYSKSNKSKVYALQEQVSSLQRKSAEPIAVLTKTPPGTLQRFLCYVHWDEQRLLDRIQWIVARDYAHPDTIGTVDDTGHPKKRPSLTS